MTEQAAAAVEDKPEQLAATIEEKPEPVIYESDNGDTAYFYFDDEPVPGCCGIE